jgi:uncharacterized protein
VNLDIGTQILSIAFALALVMGALTKRTSFCTMGAVSDWVNMGDTARFRSWMLAIAVTLIGTLGLEYAQLLSFDNSRIPYRHPSFAWPRYILGGLMFGIGMTIAGGCGSKNLVRLGAGNMKSLVVVLIMGACAYAMTRTDFYGLVFASWITPLAIDMDALGVGSQDLARIVASAIGSDSISSVRLVVGGLIVAALAYVSIGSRVLRARGEHLFAGFAIGLLVLAAWYLTGGPMGVAWIEAAEFSDEPPAFYGMQSFTFVNPAGDFWAFVGQGGKPLAITFGLAALAGMITGSFTYALLAGGLRWEWFTSIADFVRHIVGAVLMGIGGILGLGCTVGQGISGVSTLAAGSFLTLISIVIGSAMTMKVQYYKMLYEDASMLDIILTSLTDLRLLPRQCRRLEAL